MRISSRSFSFFSQRSISSWSLDRSLSICWAFSWSSQNSLSPIVVSSFRICSVMAGRSKITSEGTHSFHQFVYLAFDLVCNHMRILSLLIVFFARGPAARRVKKEFVSARSCMWIYVVPVILLETSIPKVLHLTGLTPFVCLARSYVITPSRIVSCTAFSRAAEASSNPM
jgi:hypothetical protein